MPLCEFRWFSQLLRTPTAANVLLPEVGSPPFAVLYLLHGLSDDHTTWVRQSRIEAYAAAYPLMIVMPNAGRGYYANHSAGARVPWQTHLAEELPAVIERHFAARRDAGGQAIGGLSMGGYGAMRLALAYPDRYTSVHSHSGALLGPDPRRGAMSAEEVEAIVGGAYTGSEHDLATLAERAKGTGPLPRISMDCGTEDHLLNDNRAFHARLNELGVEHIYREYPGGHTWEYWDLHVRAALAFHAAAMRL